MNPNEPTDNRDNLRAVTSDPPGRCPTCGGTHPPCSTPNCKNPTRCPPDEPSEPFKFCDTCDAGMAIVDQERVPVKGGAR